MEWAISRGARRCQPFLRVRFHLSAVKHTSPPRVGIHENSVRLLVRGRCNLSVEEIERARLATRVDSSGPGAIGMGAHVTVHGWCWMPTAPR